MEAFRDGCKENSDVSGKVFLTRISGEIFRHRVDWWYCNKPSIPPRSEMTIRLYFFFCTNDENIGEPKRVTVIEPVRNARLEIMFLASYS